MARYFALACLLAACAFAAHLTHDELRAAMSDVGRIAEYGRSVNNVPLWNVCTGNCSAVRVLVVGSIHGDETVPRTCLPTVVNRLAAARADGVMTVLDANPDGHALGTRRNVHRRDLNRCFDLRCAAERSEGAEDAEGAERMGTDTHPEFDYIDDALRAGETIGIEMLAAARLGRSACTPEDAPETAALMALIAAVRAPVVIGVHGGALLASLPYDEKCGDSHFRVLNRHEAWEAHVALGRAFVSALNGTALTMGGLVNGADWYQLHGGMQDYAFDHGAALSLTLEVSTVKNPYEPLCERIADAIYAVVDLARTYTP